MPNYHRASTQRAEDWARFDRAMDTIMTNIEASYALYRYRRESLQSYQAHMYRHHYRPQDILSFKTQHESAMYDAFKLIRRAKNTINNAMHMHFPDRYRRICSPGEIRAYASTGARVRYENEIAHARDDIARADALLAGVDEALRSAEML